MGQQCIDHVGVGNLTAEPASWGGDPCSAVETNLLVSRLCCGRSLDFDYWLEQQLHWDSKTGQTGLALFHSSWWGWSYTDEGISNFTNIIKSNCTVVSQELTSQDEVHTWIEYLLCYLVNQHSCCFTLRLWRSFSATGKRVGRESLRNNLNILQESTHVCVWAWMDEFCLDIQPWRDLMQQVDIKFEDKSVHTESQHWCTLDSFNSTSYTQTLWASALAWLRVHG